LVLARELGARLSRPYVLDYRDLWHGNPHPYRRETRRSLRAESEALEGAAAVTIISWAYAEYLESRFPCRGRVEVLPNGYDPDELRPVVGTAFPEPALVYTGAFYPPKRVIDPVLRAFRKALEAGNDARAKFHYYGGQGGMFLEAAEKAGVAAHVVDHGHCSRPAALAATKGARLGVVIADVSDEDSLSTNGILTGKVFDVIGLRIPALVVCGPRSDLHRMLEHPTWGACCRGSDLNGMAAYLSEALSGRLPTPKGSETYSWGESVKRLDAILRRVAKERKHV
jgi:glycosyltransferase involved in cell wall biosynthesis